MNDLNNAINDLVTAKVNPLLIRIEALEKALNDPTRGETVEDFMPISYFVKKYGKSSETLRKVRKQYGRINDVSVFGVLKLNTEQMTQAINSYVPGKLSMGKYNHNRKSKRAIIVKQQAV